VHARLATGENASVSLAAAQRELIRGGYPPSTWAGFTVVGGNDAERMR
jgi:hypothetical protein